MTLEEIGQLAAVLMLWSGPVIAVLSFEYQNSPKRKRERDKKFFNSLYEK